MQYHPAEPGSSKQSYDSEKYVLLGGGGGCVSGMDLKMMKYFVKDMPMLARFISHRRKF